MIERLKFFRRTAHVPSMIAPMMLLLSCVSLAQSQPPQQSNPTSGNQPSASNKSGTLQSPLIVRILPTENTTADAAQQKRETDEKSEDRVLTRNVAKLGLTLSALQAFIIGFQVYLLRRQNVIFAGQTTIMSGQLLAATNAANAARDAVRMTHRPKLIVREISIPDTLKLFPIGQTAHLGNDAAEGLPTILEGTFRLTNKGESGAVLGMIEATIYLGKALPPENPCYGHLLDLPEGGQVAAGWTAQIPFKPFPITPADIGRIRRGQLKLFAIGKVIYVDGAGGGRRTGFARHFNLETGRFHMPTKGEPDYDYQD